MKDNVVFLGLGGNIGDTYKTLNAALKEIKLLNKVSHLEVSGFYGTAPIGCIPSANISLIDDINDHFVNIVCCLHTSFTLTELFHEMQNIEQKLGKTPKPKNFPRKIDIDILFYNDETLKIKDLIVPHVHWKERLFVLIPLLDLMEAKSIKGPFGISSHDLKVLINRFSDTERQEIVKL